MSLPDVKPVKCLDAPLLRVTLHTLRAPSERVFDPIHDSGHNPLSNHKVNILITNKQFKLPFVAYESPANRVSRSVYYRVWDTLFFLISLDCDRRSAKMTPPSFVKRYVKSRGTFGP